MNLTNIKAFHSNAKTCSKSSMFLALLMVLYLPTLQAEDLLTVYNQAVQEDPQLEKAKEALEAVKETQTQASANLFLPEASFSANINTDWQHIKNRGDAIIAGDLSQSAVTSENFNTMSYTLSVTQPILHYDRIVQWQQADSRIAQAISQFAAAESELLLRVAERYFGVLAAEENLGYAKAQQESLMQKLEETKLHEAAGYLAMTDVQEAQGGYDRAVADAIQAEHQLRNAQESLQEVTGIQYNQLASLKQDIPLVQPEPAIEGTWVEQALTQNLGLKASEYASQIAKAEIDVQKAGHWPTIDATGSHSFNATGGRFGAADIEDNTLGLSLNVPLFQGGKVSSRIREAEHRYREAKAALKQEQRSVHRTASQAFLGVTAGISRVKALQQTLKSSEIGVKATESGFRVGYRTPLDLIVAERERLSAQRDYTQARYDYILSTLRLKQAVGTLSPEDLAKVNGWLASATIDQK